ncbi:MAG TPA: helix-turn-helix domain-containing protein [Symbiobacteriaceae bacterium]|nr:helix-turn-helix domain-containing protein [Symbiobacteriaceae bacterium]
MTDQSVWVPFSVLGARNHTASARLIWILLDREPAGLPTAMTEKRLRNVTGLDPETIASARTRLAASPLAPGYARPRRGCAAIPLALIADAALSARARLLYGQLQGVPDFENRKGSFTYASLADFTGTSDDALRRAVAELVAAGWLTFTQGHRKRPFQFTLHNPVGTNLWARISHLRRRVRGAQYRGEALLREYLNVLVDLDQHEENATLDQLLNPYTKELLELDRYYPTAAVAFELNGAQHYEETELATFSDTVKQVGRDAMKAFICKAIGIELVILHPEDLRLKTLEKKIPKRLPRRDRAGMEPLLAELDVLASEYRSRTVEERERSRVVATN